MFTAALSKTTERGMAILGRNRLLDQAYLAGGTALALQLGHRISYDLDFFTPVKFRTDLMAQKLVEIKGFKLKQTDWGTVLGRFKEIDFSLFYYQYPLLKPTIKFKDINIASLEDIAAMKIAAIGDRGTKRDFIDLYFLRDQFDLARMLKLYDQKYQALKSNQIHILKSLVYFNDADNDYSPDMIKPVDWNQVKKFFITQVRQFEQGGLKK